GIGMAFPYFILTCFPRLLKFVPKPGAWMVYLKQFFGFIMTSVVIWLVWVLSVQRGSEAAILILIGLFFIAFGLWFHRISRGQKGLLFLIIFCSIGLYISFYAGSKSVLSIVGERKIETDKINWEAYDRTRFSQYLSENKPVFLDFTAAWCLSCQVNERTVFYNQTIIDRFNKSGIVSIKADWTNYDPEITKALNAYGKNGIPLYVFYPKGNQSEYVILPEIITPQIILSTLDKYFNE
nr:thioredoxin family protein [Candidatus Omnitrophota bacterium]